MDIFDKIKKGKEKDPSSNSKPKQAGLFAGMSVKTKKPQVSQNTTENNGSHSLNEIDSKYNHQEVVMPKEDNKNDLLDSNDLLTSENADFNNEEPKVVKSTADNDLYDLLDEIEKEVEPEPVPELQPKPKAKPAFGFIKNRKTETETKINDEILVKPVEEPLKVATHEDIKPIEEPKPKAAFRFIKDKKSTKATTITPNARKDSDDKNSDAISFDPISATPPPKETNKDSSDNTKTESFRQLNEFNESNLEISIRKSKNDSHDHSNMSLAENDTIEQITKDLDHGGFAERIENDFKINKTYSKISKKIEEYSDRVFLIINHINKAEEEDEDAIGNMQKLTTEILELDDDIAQAVAEEDFTRADELNQIQNSKKEALESTKDRKDGFFDKIALLDIKDSGLAKLEKALSNELKRLLEDKITIREKRTLYERESSSNFEKRQEELEDIENEIDENYKSLKSSIDKVEKKLNAVDENQTKSKKPLLAKNEQLSKSKNNLLLDIERLKRELAEKEAELELVDDQLAENEEGIYKIDETFDVKKDEILRTNEDLYNKKNLCDNKMANMNEKMDELEAERTVQRNELQKLENMLQQISDSEVNHKTRIEDIKKVIKRNQTALSEYAAVKREYMERVSGLNALRIEIEADEQLINQIERDIEVRNKEIDEIEAEIPRISTRKQEAISSKNFASAGQLNKDLQRLQTRLVSVKQEIETYIQNTESTSKSLPDKIAKLVKSEEASASFVVEYHRKLVDSLNMRTELLTLIQLEGNNAVQFEIELLQKKLVKARENLDSSIKPEPDSQKYTSVDCLPDKNTKLVVETENGVTVEHNKSENNEEQTHGLLDMEYKALVVDYYAKKIKILGQLIENAISGEDFEAADNIQTEINRLDHKFSVYKEETNKQAQSYDELLASSKVKFDGLSEDPRNDLITQINKLFE